MYNSVRTSFAAFSSPLEGVVPWMYQDSEGLVTVAIGNLIDSPAAAWETRNYGAPFVKKSDMVTEATQAEVTEDWDRVKDDPELKGNWPAAEHVTKLRLTGDGVANLVANKLQAFENSLRQTPEFSGLDAWPADAQLALFSMAWAQGTGFGDWPNFRAACAAADWSAAVQDCNMSNEWMGKRNAVNRGMFRNAAWVVKVGVEPGELQLTIPGNRPTLSMGATDQDHAGLGFDGDDSASSLQRFLTFLDFPCPETGTFDQATDDAVHAFQAGENELAAAQGGFAVDGVVGRLTWAALGYVVPNYA